MARARQPSGLGRPRDPEMNQRVLETALSAYVDLGWSGLSLDVVARRARVGKAALYLRWPSKEALLHDALRTTALELPEEHLDTGSIRGDLLRLASLWLEGFQTPAGLVFMRVYSETAAHPEILARFQDDLFSERIKAGRAIVRRARERGEVPAETSTTLVLDLVVGAVMNHVMSTPAALHQRMVEQGASFVEQLVDFVLLGIHATGASRARAASGAAPSASPTRSPRPRKKARTQSPAAGREGGKPKARPARRRGGMTSPKGPRPRR